MKTFILFLAYMCGEIWGTGCIQFCVNVLIGLGVVVLAVIYPYFALVLAILVLLVVAAALIADSWDRFKKIRKTKP